MLNSLRDLSNQQAVLIDFCSCDYNKMPLECDRVHGNKSCFSNGHEVVLCITSTWWLNLDLGHAFVKAFIKK